ncbi:TetR/AcrR family transcriptional regulator [Glycomyces tritici]|uniref:TetR/AcrR family transcriptional regulator n=1 Tax=Glycomyces tritici TaxID=2665176 RepID=A0ABT7YTY7_9ACTN|nr:TetR/AcrR family transcriptional regulator [Glycomyces tritici]MDN3242078.1 TetR/AcrR family transcriptional regulator [Glycomyces tritici]
MSTEPGTARRSLNERRQQLLDAAVEVMSERGVAATTTRAITEAAGVPQGMFHYCFDSKSALLRDLLERECETALAAAWQLDPGTDTFTGGLAKAVQTQLARVRTAPGPYLVLAELTVAARTDPELLELSRWERRQYVDLVKGQLQRWKLDLPEAELESLAVVIIAGIEGLTDAWLTTRDDEAGVAAAELFASGIGALVEARLT